MSDLESASTSTLLEHIDSGEERQIIEAAREIASRQELSGVPSLLGVLKTTENGSVRNAVALALSDLNDPSTFDVLVDLLRSERTRGNRGTLLYALGNYDCSSILSLLVDSVIDGNFEVSRQALALISGIEVDLAEDAVRTYTERLRSALSVATDERRPLIQELLSMFEQA